MEYNGKSSSLSSSSSSSSSANKKQHQKSHDTLHVGRVNGFLQPEEVELQLPRFRRSAGVYQQWGCHQPKWGFWYVFCWLNMVTYMDLRIVLGIWGRFYGFLSDFQSSRTTLLSAKTSPFWGQTRWWCIDGECGVLMCVIYIYMIIYNYIYNYI